MPMLLYFSGLMHLTRLPMSPEKNQHLAVSGRSILTFLLGIYLPLGIASITCMLLLPGDRFVAPSWLMYSLGWNLAPLLLLSLFASLIEPMASDACRRVMSKLSSKPAILFLFGSATTLVTAIAASLSAWITWWLLVPIVPQTAGWVFFVGIGVSVLVANIVAAAWIID